MLSLLFVILFPILSSQHTAINYTSDNYCGLSFADRIVGGSSAALGQYPWMARLGYLINRQVSFDCGGALVSQRHVITAAHCVTGLPIDVKIYCVDLGENTVDNEPDCDDAVCADPIQRITISSIESHADYNKPSFKNDIALVRLRTNAQITPWVLPVCLPLDSSSLLSGVAEVAGFGLSDTRRSHRKTKLQTLKVAIVDLNRCTIVFEPSISIDDRQMCVGGKLGQDSCAGDSGGPLVKAMINIKFVGPRYFIIGIVSFGLTSCGETATPSIYTSVLAYMPWIVQNMQ